MEIYRASDGAALAFDERGPAGGVPLLFVHGWRADHRIWDPLVDLLARRHRTILVDLRGSGESQGAPGPYTIEAFSNDLSDLFAAISHSMGSAVAQRFAIDNPPAVEGQVLIAPIPASGPHFKPSTEDFLRSTVGDPMKSAAWLQRLTRHEPDPETHELLAAAAASVPPRAALAMLDGWLRLDFADEAATIETPTLVVVPEHDPPMTPDFVREHVAGLIVGSRLEIVADSGHYLPLEKPAELAALIERFLVELLEL
jgi:pimeloyl-ACP methyl ester carboxylesterase